MDVPGVSPGGPCPRLVRLVASCRRLLVWLLRYLAASWRVPSSGIACRELTAGRDRPPAGTSVA